MAVIDRAHRDRDHLAFELRKTAFAKHEVVRHIDERFQFLVVERIRLEDVGYKAELFLAGAEIIAKLQVHFSFMELQCRQGRALILIVETSRTSC